VAGCHPAGRPPFGWLELLFPLFVLAVSIHLLIDSYGREPVPHDPESAGA